MFPLRDSIPSSRAPLVNVTVIVACVAVFVHVGGFVAGAVLATWLRRSGRACPRPRNYIVYGSEP